MRRNEEKQRQVRVEKNASLLHNGPAPTSIRCCLYQARAERGLLTNRKYTTPGPSHSIEAPKMYILGKHILGTQILMLRFVD